MKWVKISAILFIGVAAANAARTEQNGPWSFSNITVVTIPSSATRVTRTSDHRGIDIVPKSWSAEMEQEIKSQLSSSPLSYRLHALPDSRIAVEIYSLSTAIDFDVRSKTK